MTPAEINDLRERFTEAAFGPPVLLDRLPVRTRLRLWISSRIDHAGCWLVEHDHYRAAQRLWRL